MSTQPHTLWSCVDCGAGFKVGQVVRNDTDGTHHVSHDETLGDPLRHTDMPGGTWEVEAVSAPS